MFIYETRAEERVLSREIESSTMSDVEVADYIADRRSENKLAVFQNERPRAYWEDYLTGYSFNPRDFSIYPDNRIRVSWHNQYRNLLGGPNATKYRIDFADLLVDPDNRINIKHSYEVWAALHDHHSEVDQWGHLAFEKILLDCERRKPPPDNPPADYEDVWEPAVMEIDTPQMLSDIIRLRRQRHNAAHNAKKIVEPDYLPFVEAVKKAYEDAPPLSIDYQPFIDAWKALEDFDVEAKMQAAARLDAQAPTQRTTVAGRREQAVDELRRAVGKRIHELTGRDGWYADLTIHSHGTSEFMRRVDEAAAVISSRNTVEQINRSLEIYKRNIQYWHFDFDLETNIELFEAVRILYVFAHVSQPSKVECAVELDDPPRPQGDVNYDPVYVVSEPSVRNLDSVGCAFFLVRISNPNVPEDTLVNITVTATQSEVLLESEAKTLTEKLSIRL